MNKLTEPEEKEFALLYKKIFGNLEFFNFDGINDAIVMNRYNYLTNKKMNYMLSPESIEENK